MNNTELDNIKRPPHSLEAECSVLGGLLLDNSSWEYISDKIIYQDFFRKSHQLIFKAIQYLLENSREVDVVTLFEFLEQEGVSDEVGGLAYIANMVKNTPSVSNIASYAEIVRDRAVLRNVIRVCNEVADSAFSPKGQKTSEILDIAEKKIFKIAEQRESEEDGLKIAKHF